MYCYIHPEDQQDLSNVLEAGKEELENPSNEAAAGRYTDDIPYFGNEQGELRLSPPQRLRHRATGDGGKHGSPCQVSHPNWLPSGGGNLQCTTRWGGLRTLCQ